MGTLSSFILASLLIDQMLFVTRLVRVQSVP